MAVTTSLDGKIIDGRHIQHVRVYDEDTDFGGILNMIPLSGQLPHWRQSVDGVTRSR
jgi:hypothetical protein